MKGKTSRVLSIYLPQDSVLCKKVIFAEHKRSLYGGSHDNASCYIIILDTTFKTLIKVGNQKLLWM